METPRERPGTVSRIRCTGHSYSGKSAARLSARARRGLIVAMNRRTFLKSAAGAIALSAAPAFLGAEDKSETYTTALIGCGWWGGNILGAALAAGQSKLV